MLIKLHFIVCLQTCSMRWKNGAAHKHRGALNKQICEVEVDLNVGNSVNSTYGQLIN